MTFKITLTGAQAKAIAAQYSPQELIAQHNLVITKSGSDGPQLAFMVTNDPVKTVSPAGAEVKEFHPSDFPVLPYPARQTVTQKLGHREAPKITVHTTETRFNDWLHWNVEFEGSPDDKYRPLVDIYPHYYNWCVKMKCRNYTPKQFTTAFRRATDGWVDYSKAGERHYFNMTLSRRPIYKKPQR